MPPLFDIAGKAAIVTGASSGLGRHFALTLARQGAKVALMARRIDRLAELRKEIEGFDGRAVEIALDLARGESVREAVAAAEEELGPIAILVNNAGLAEPKAALELTEAEWDRTLDVNLRGAWLMAQETAKHMVRLGHGGSIVNIASITAFRVVGHLAAYAASKAALVQLTSALALELARHRIRVNAIAPGYIETEINRDYFASPAGAALVKRIPQRRLGKPEDLEGALLLLASEASAFMTGSVIVVDGGHLHSPL
ncbi:MAG TPA: glucose 1-dehydrogenase [Alphaproteobacteria bacterium]|nr:glucose 1-dehydrogenase [Alphaproteobacteria bacterium]